MSESSVERARRLLENGQPRKAASILSTLVAPASADAGVLGLLARALYEDNQLLPALRVYDRLASMDQATAEDWYTMGECLFELGEHAQSIGILERALKLEPGSARTLHRLAWSSYRLGDVDRAVKLLEKAVRISSTMGVLGSLATIVPGAPSASHKKILSTRLRFAKQLTESENLSASPCCKSPHSPARKQRIGYLSSFFNGANYMKPVWSLINNHDREQFFICLYSDCDGDPSNAGYRSHPDDRLRRVSGMSNQDLADLIARDGIDLLVDLNAYSAPDRLGLFSSRRAPAVVAWFNMYATSGLPGFDYIVGDAETVLPAEDRFYTESVERLPLSYLTFEVNHRAPPVVNPPSATNGFLTFGSLVSQYKITPAVIDTWARILRKTQGSRLFVANTTMKSLHNRNWLHEQFARRGVEAERVDIAGPAKHYQFLQYYDRMDIALDAWPYNGGTTTMEALWQGVPVLTLQGDRWAARTSQTLLRRAELSEWVAGSKRSLVQKAIQLSCDAGTVGRLSELRHGMRARLLISPACDGLSLAVAMESFYKRVLLLDSER